MKTRYYFFLVEKVWKFVAQEEVRSVWWLFFCITVSHAMVRKGLSSMDVASQWVQILRGRAHHHKVGQRPKQRRDRQLGDGGILKVQAVKQPEKPRQPRVGPVAAWHLAKTKIAKLERALEVMGGMDGPAIEAIMMELEKARLAFKTPPLNVEIEETHKFIARSVRRLTEMERSVRWKKGCYPRLRESGEDVGRAGKKAKSPRTTTRPHFTSDTPSTEWKYASIERDALAEELTWRGRMRRVEKLHSPQNSEERQAAKRQACPPGNPQFRGGGGRLDVHEAPRSSRRIGDRSIRVGGGAVTVDHPRCFGDPSFLSPPCPLWVTWSGEVSQGDLLERSVHEGGPKGQSVEVSVGSGVGKRRILDLSERWYREVRRLTATAAHPLCPGVGGSECSSVTMRTANKHCAPLWPRGIRLARGSSSQSKRGWSGCVWWGFETPRFSPQLSPNEMWVSRWARSKAIRTSQ